MTSKYLAGLEQALAEVEAQLSAHDSLLEKKRVLVGLISAEKQPSAKQPTLNLNVQTLHTRSTFTANPASMASRRMEAAVEFMDSHGFTEAPFLQVYSNLPPELNGSPKAREAFRTAILASGKRVGLLYEKRANGPVIIRQKPSV